jgi:hypothetical protein
MANLIRSAKDSDDWTQNELAAYNITIVTQNKQEFFGSADLPVPVIPSLSGFMTSEDREHAVDGETRKFLHHLDLALNQREGYQAAIINFAVNILKKLGYDSDDRRDDGGDRIIFFDSELPLDICGVSCEAFIGASVMGDDNEVLLLLDSDSEENITLDDTEPQLVAQAIAAYAANNKVRTASLNLPPLADATLPAILMKGTVPVLYKIPVTAELYAAVQQGTYPALETRVLRYVPVLPSPYEPGMGPLENRVESLACLEAFKRFVGDKSR